MDSECKLCNRKNCKMIIQNKQIWIGEMDGELFGAPVEHRADIGNSEASGLIKLFLSAISKAYPDKSFDVKLNKESHWHIRTKADKKNGS